MLRVYLAAPFFTQSQVHRLEVAEGVLRALPHVILYSPRQDGVILRDLPAAERAAASADVFKTNIAKLDWCDHVLACIDDRDPGTIWEMGYAYAKGKRIVTFTTQDYGLNVMLQCCVVAHVRLYTDLAYLFNSGVSDAACKQFRDFDPRTT